MAFLCNAFNDPSNPWYYVIGVVFLLVIFGALAAYIILTGKKKKGKEEKPTAEQPTETDSATDNADEQPAAEPTEQKNEDKKE